MESWRELEKLVAVIEGAMLPTGATVKSPDRILDKVSGSLREVDASIRYKVGTTPILITVECRDRTSVQDATWIEQLATKRSSIGANQTIAVATQGFSKPAQRTAKAFGIELRTVSEIDATIVQGWLSAVALKVSRLDVEPAQFLCDLDVETYPRTEQEFLFASFQQSLDGGSARFRRAVSADEFSFVQLWEELSRHFGTNVPSDGTRYGQQVDVQFIHGHVQACCANKWITVRKMRLVARVQWTSASETSSARFIKYAGADQDTYNVAHARVEVDGLGFAASIRHHLETDTMAVACSVIDDDRITSKLSPQLFKPN